MMITKAARTTTMTMSERNARQMKIAKFIARRRGYDVLTAVELIARAFARKYPHTYAPATRVELTTR